MTNRALKIKVKADTIIIIIIIIITTHDEKRNEMSGRKKRQQLPQRKSISKNTTHDYRERKTLRNGEYVKRNWSFV
jgi:hypothetical protein